MPTSCVSLAVHLGGDGRWRTLLCCSAGKVVLFRGKAADFADEAIIRAQDEAIILAQNVWH
ncbi:MAG: hypothetical protein DRR06_08915 [Gammaproteobacteria bacterium]|nr:MAG: hypothetical protein DRR06_08915 [Gammaproteobacteria bacterium]